MGKEIGLLRVHLLQFRPQNSRQLFCFSQRPPCPWILRYTLPLHGFAFVLSMFSFFFLLHRRRRQISISCIYFSVHWYFTEHCSMNYWKTSIIFFVTQQLAPYYKQKFISFIQSIAFSYIFLSSIQPLLLDSASLSRTLLPGKSLSCQIMFEQLHLNNKTSHNGIY